MSGDVLNVVGVDPGLVAAEAGVMGGDRIIAMNGRPVKELSNAERIECLRGSPLRLSIERGGDVIEVTLTLD